MGDTTKNKAEISSVKFQEWISGFFTGEFTHKEIQITYFGTLQSLTGKYRLFDNPFLKFGWGYLYPIFCGGVTQPFPVRYLYQQEVQRASVPILFLPL